MAERRLSLGEQAALAVLHLTALRELGGAYDAPWIVALAVPAAISLRWRWTRPPRALVQLLEHLSWALLGGLTLFALGWSLYVLLPQGSAAVVVKAIGLALSLLATISLVGSTVWRPGRAFVPSALGMLAAAAFNTDRPLPYLAVAVAVLALAVFAAFEAAATAKRAKARLLPGLAFGVPVLGLAYGIARLLPWAQPHVEAATAEAFLSQGRQYAGLSETSTLGAIEELALSPRIVMRVDTPVPQNLRAHVFTRFDGRNWRPPGRPLIDLPPAGPEAAVGFEHWLGPVPGRFFLASPAGGASRSPRTIPTRVVQVVWNGGALAMPQGIRLLRVDAASAKGDALGVVSVGFSELESYGTLNVPEVSEAADPPRLSEALELPADLDARLHELAARLGEGGPPAEERVRRVSDHLARECHYSLKVGRFATSQPVAEFLFEKKRGYCEYFASAAAVLLRLQGVPTRYVTGFCVRDENRVAGRYLVREADAHAWIEVFLPGRGWVEADPTPAAEYAALHEPLRAGALEAVFEWVRGRWAELRTLAGAGAWRALLAWLRREALGPLAALLLAALLWRGLRGRLSRRRRPRQPRTEDDAPAHLRDLLKRVDAVMARCGCARPPTAAPLQHLEALSPEALPAGLREASREALACFYRGRFAGQAVSATETQTLVRRLDEHA